jgi:hypothetical protein
MNEKNMVVIFHDKSKLFITAKEASNIFKQSGENQEKIILHGSMYSFSSIQKILTIEEFYKEYPLQAPPKEKDITPYVSKIQHPTQKAKELLLKGLKQFCDENPYAKKAKAFYNLLSSGKGANNSNLYWAEVAEKYQGRTDLSESEQKHFEHALSKIS